MKSTFVFLLLALLLVGCSNTVEDNQVEDFNEERQPTDTAPEQVLQEETPEDREEIIEDNNEAADGDLNSRAPKETVRIIFVHHSTGENWLRDDYGGLGKELDNDNFFLSDTNYGWGPEGIGDRTDIINWREWFRSENTPTFMDALFEESGQHADYTRTASNPGGMNEVIIIKSCFPNSAVSGNPNDPARDEGDQFTVSNYKFIYNDLLKYFGEHPEKLFIIVTAPPLLGTEYASNARAFNEWLRNDWLRENNYRLKNVVVFDFYNILTSENAHHRHNNGNIEHLIDSGRNTLRYPSSGGDEHPSEEGSRKATREFVPFLNVYYHCWKGDGGCPS